MRITEKHGDEPITLRALVEIAENAGWDFDTRLTFFDCALEVERIVRGVACVPGAFGPGDQRIEFNTEHQRKWKAEPNAGEMIGDLVREGRLDPRDADRLLEAVGVAL